MSLLDPMLSHRFQATFYFKLLRLGPSVISDLGVPDPIDIDFSSISGLDRQVRVNSRQEGGRNVGSLHLPEQVTHSQLVMTRGVTLKTPLTVFFELAFGRFQFIAMDIHIVAYDQGKPYMDWTVCEAIPVSWSTSPLSADSSQILLNTFTLAYRDLRLMGLYS